MYMWTYIYIYNYFYCKMEKHPYINNFVYILRILCINDVCVDVYIYMNI